MAKGKAVAAAPAAPVEPETTTPTAPAAEASVGAKSGNPIKGTFRVFDDRANLVAQVTDEGEAKKIADEFKGTYTKLN